MADKKSGIDQALIRDLAHILNDTDLTEIEVEQDDLRIRVSRNGTPVPMQMPAYNYQAPAAPAPAASRPKRRWNRAASVPSEAPFRLSVSITAAWAAMPARVA